MSNVLIPTDDVYIETIARAIAKNRIYQEASISMRKTTGASIEEWKLEESFEALFEIMWSGTTEHDELQKSQYREDARAAISAINLKLLTSIE